MKCGGFVHRGDAHKAADIEAAIFAAEFQKCGEGFRRDACLLFLVSCVHLDQAGDRAFLFLHFSRESAGEFFAVYGFDHVEERYGLFHLVGLERSDEVEFKIGIEGLNVFPVGDGLLNAVFTKQAVSSIEGFANFFGWLGFADRDEVNLLGCSVPFPGGFFDVLEDVIQVFSDGHRGTIKQPEKKRKGA